MKQIHWPMLAFAFGAVFCMGGIGISIAARSITGIFSCLIVLVFVMGFGFKTKKKLRENGML